MVLHSYHRRRKNNILLVYISISSVLDLGCSVPQSWTSYEVEPKNGRNRPSAPRRSQTGVSCQREEVCHEMPRLSHRGLAHFVGAGRGVDIRAPLRTPHISKIERHLNSTDFDFALMFSSAFPLSTLLRVFLFRFRTPFHLIFALLCILSLCCFSAVGCP